MRNFYLYILAISISLLTVSGSLFAQISNGGTPPSIIFQIDDDFQKLSFESPDIIAINKQDILDETEEGPSPHRMGVSVIVDKGIENSGNWTELPGGDKIWRLEIEVPGALALGVYYDDFYLPEGGKLFLYNSDKKQILGAYTSQVNPEENLFSTQFIKGDKVTVEYWQPKEQNENPILNISEVAYAYRDIEFGFDNERSSWWCMIDVACEEGDNWENQIDGAARISIKIGGSYYWCSGSLINNTENDRTPYFLTAAHCGGSASSYDLNQWVFYFNYQASTCGGNSSGSQTITGCSLKAKDNSEADNGSDFYLVEFNQSIPSSYNVFYNGWNRTNEVVDAGNGVGVHHPAGDIKKISTYNSPLQSSTFWNGLPTHWKLLWAETVNGKSIMQGGSSGSPIFDSNGLIMGNLTGGYLSNSCTSPSPAYYGKIWYSWDQNGNTADSRLKDWLDPNNIGIEKLPGVSWQVIQPTADFEANTTTITQGDTVFFSDISNPGIIEREWTFENGSPAISTERNPYVIYSDIGDFDVTIYVENADGSDTELKEDFIHVTAMPLPTAEFDAEFKFIKTNKSNHFYDLSTSDIIEWYWEFEGGSPATSTLPNPQSRWSTEGTYDITLTVTNLGGDNIMVKEDYITVGGDAPMANFESSNTHITQNETVNFTDISTNNPEYWEWTFEGGTPEYSEEQNPQGIIYEEGGAFSVTLKVINGIGDDTMLMEDYILVDWVGMSKFEGANDFRVYPNPGNGIFVVKFAEADAQDVTIQVMDNTGRQIREFRPNRNKSFVIDLSSEKSGLYIINLISGNTTVSKKISLVK